MLITISTDHRPATDLGYLLHKNPSTRYCAEFGFGRAHVAYPEATNERCTVAVVVDVDPVGLVRRRGPKGNDFSLRQYVNDRPYATSSFTSVDLGKVFSTAMAGRSKERPELAKKAIPFEVHLPVTPSRGGEEIAHRLFEPLGYEVTAHAIPLDPRFPQWGDSQYVDLALTATVTLKGLLEHLFVLLPVLDDDKHYWVGPDEIDKLLRRGGDWLSEHPERELITRRYLRHDRQLTREALGRLMEDDLEDPGEAEARYDAQERAVEKPGKSTFAARHFLPTEALSSDFCRGLVADEENDQSATNAAFEVLYYIAGKRLEAGRLTVVDATNVQAEARRSVVNLAKANNVLAVAIVLDVPEEVCAARNASRPDRQFGPHVLRNQRNQLRRSIRGLRREGFHRVYHLKDEGEIAEATVEREPLWNDRRSNHGPFDIIGDVHGCYEELKALLTVLGYEIDPDGLSARHPHGRRAVFLGDLVDRGPATPAVLRLVMGMTGEGSALCIPGNHEVKLLRALNGRNVTTGHGLAQSLEQLSTEPPEFLKQVTSFLDGLISHFVLDEGDLWWRTLACRPTCKGAPQRPSARSPSTATQRERPTSTACRCATRGRRTIEERPRSSTAIRRYPRLSG